MDRSIFHCVTWSDDLRRLYTEVARGRPATSEETRFLAESLSWMEVHTNDNKRPR